MVGKRRRWVRVGECERGLGQKVCMSVSEEGGGHLPVGQKRPLRRQGQSQRMSYGIIGHICE